MTRNRNLALCLTFAALSSSSTFAAELLVPSQFATIQDAVKAAQPGDKVLVAEGAEAFGPIKLVNKTAITVLGAPGVTIDAAGTNHGILIQNCDDVKVDGFLVLNADVAGVLVAGGTGVKVKRVETTGSVTGFRVGESANDALLTKCVARDGKHGFAISGTETTLKRCVVGDVEGEGVILGGSLNTVRDCDIESAAGFGVRIGGEGNLLQETRISDCGIGIRVDTAVGAMIDANQVRDSISEGIHLFKLSSDVFLSKNKVSGSGADGIRVEGTTSALLFKNKVVKSGADGIRLRPSDLPSRAMKNKVKASGNHGFFVQCSDSEFVKNTAKKSGAFDLRDTGNDNLFESNAFATIAP